MCAGTTEVARSSRRLGALSMCARDSSNRWLCAQAANGIFRLRGCRAGSTTTLPMVLCAFGSPTNYHVPDRATVTGYLGQPRTLVP
jgi:hypothetical protein